MGTKKETIVLTLETRKTVESHNGMTNDTDGSALDYSYLGGPGCERRKLSGANNF